MASATLNFRSMPRATPACVTERQVDVKRQTVTCLGGRPHGQIEREVLILFAGKGTQYGRHPGTAPALWFTVLRARQLRIAVVSGRKPLGVP